MSGIRPFEDRDYRRYVEVGNASYPEYAWTVAEASHDDATWTDARYFKARFVSEDDTDRVVGILDLHHQRGWFHPQRYRCEVTVDPAHRRRGHGSALLDHAVALVRARGGELLVGSTKESPGEGVAFLTKRGCVERQRSWESRLDVAAFDFARFAGAQQRVAAHGIRIATLAEETRKDRDGALRKAYDLQELTRRDIPSVDPATEGDFAVFLSYQDAPTALPDAYFLAVRDDEYVGLSNLWRDLTNDDNLYQGLTAVHPAWRGKGIAMGLKLQTVRYAHAHRKREIRTWNNTRNRPMLRINEAMGFVRQPAWVEFEKRLSGPAPASPELGRRSAARRRRIRAVEEAPEA